MFILLFYNFIFPFLPKYRILKYYSFTRWYLVEQAYMSPPTHTYLFCLIEIFLSLLSVIIIHINFKVDLNNSGKFYLNIDWNYTQFRDLGEKIIFPVWTLQMHGNYPCIFYPFHLFRYFISFNKIV